jgi:hypothetical protein
MGMHAKKRERPEPMHRKHSSFQYTTILTLLMAKWAGTCIGIKNLLRRKQLFKAVLQLELHVRLFTASRSYATPVFRILTGMHHILSPTLITASFCNYVIHF